MLPIKNVNNMALLSKKIYGHVNKFRLQFYVYIYDIKFMNIFKNYNILNLKLNNNFNKDISCLANSFPQLTSLDSGYYFDQDISCLANSFPQLKNILHCNYTLYKKYTKILIKN